TDIAKITRKRSKQGKNEHEKERVHKSRKECHVSIKEAQPRGEYYTKHSAKEAHHSKEVGLPAWQSVCSQSHPRAKNKHPMIRRIDGQDQKERVQV
ncbi:hypothetical protein Tco_0415102, partial [Tanacetum coccineum]